MDSFMKMLSTQALMLIYMCVGYYCNKKKIFDKATEIKLTDFVLQVTMPCMVFNSFNMKLTMDFVKEASFCLALSCDLRNSLAAWQICIQSIPGRQKEHSSVWNSGK